MDAVEIIRQLEGDPGLRTQLRALLLADEILQLPALVAANSRDIQKLIEVVAANSRDIQELKEVVAANSRDIQELKEVVAANSRDIQELKEVVAANSRDILELKEVVASVERRLESVEHRMDSLERGQESLRQEVGRLSDIVGGTVEDDATSVVVTVVERRGWVVHGAPQPFEYNGEIDVLGEATTDVGGRVSLLVEAKTRLRPADVRRFAGKVDQLVAGAGIEGDYLAYVYGLRVYTGVEETASDLGLGVLCPDGERVPAAARTR